MGEDKIKAPIQELVEGGDIVLICDYDPNGKYLLFIYDKAEDERLITKKSNTFILDNESIKRQVVQELLDLRPRIYDHKKDEVRKYITQAYANIRPAYEQYIKNELAIVENLKGVRTNSAIRLDNYITNVEEFHTIQPFFYDKNRIFWLWDNDEYRFEVADDTQMMVMIDDALGLKGQTVTTSIKCNYMEAFKRVGRSRIPRDAPTKWIQFKDKAISLKSREIYDVTPDYFFTNPIPWSLSDSSETPTMDKLFEEWVGNQYVMTLYEIIAYCCYRGYPIQTIIALCGHGRNGKSQFLKTMDKFLGNENTCSTELDTLVDTRFESFKLFKKLLCQLGETNFGLLKKTSLLKKLSGGDRIGFEKKGKDPFDDYNYAKIVIASNSLPSSEDTSDGFMRRWIIIDFPNEFKEGKEIYQTIPDIEYSNLARKVVDILPALLKSGEISNQGTITERRSRYIMASNPLPIFLRACCNFTDDFYVVYSRLYTAYIKFLSFRKKRRVKLSEFKSGLEDAGFWVERENKNIEGEWKTNRYINGIDLKPDWESRIGDTCDVSSIDSHSVPHVKEQVEKYVTDGISVTRFEEMDENTLKCYVCGASPVKWTDSKCQGKPTCDECKVTFDTMKD